MARWLALVAAMLLAGEGAAQVLPMPSTARQVSERILELGRYALPLGPWDGQTVPHDEVEGRIEQRSWRIESGAMTTLQASGPLEEALVAEGFEILFDCIDSECGGFDFRFSVSVIPAPDMYVDLRDFQNISARRGEEEVVNLLISRGPAAIWIQETQVFPGAYMPEDDAERVEPRSEVEIAFAQPDASSAPEPAPGDFSQELASKGFAELSDLTFASGSVTLDEGSYATLGVLADLMTKDPDLRIALVGHTDLSGSLEVNMRVSRQRAQSVKQRLVSRYGIASGRIEAEGIGYLSPLASVLTKEGQAANRRVEVVLLSP